MLVSGSGDGLVDAAAAGLIEGDEAILYSASMTGDELLAAAEDAGAIIVTDSNRRRSHHWRNSQDVSGYTETGDGPAVLWNDSGDARLVVFPDADLPAYTLSRSEGEVTAVATSYGARFEYQPETRAALAIDGDPNTAWTVLDHTNQLIELRTEAGVDHVTLLQPNGLDPVRHLRNVTISVNGGTPIPVVLNDQSLVVGQQVSFPATDGPTTIRIRLGTVTSADRSGRPDRTGVGFAEIDLGLGDSPEVITVPTDLTTAMSEGGVVRPVTYVLTRERVRPTNRWRADPEWRIVRVIDVPAAQDVTVGVDVRLDLRASDAVLAGLLGIEGPTASARLTGAPTAGGWAAADGDVATAWVTPFNRVNGSALNATLIAPGEPMTIRQRLGNYTRITAVMMTQGDRTVFVPIPEPNAAGESTVIAPAEFEPGPIRIEIVGTLERTTRDRRLADTVLMPAAISEITNIEPATIPDSFETECRDDLVVIDGEPVAVRVAGSLADAFDGAELDATVCDPTSLSLSAGEHRVLGQDNRRIGLQVDRIVLDAGSGAGVTGEAGPTATLTSSSRLGRDVTVDGCVQGCWLILGEGFHDAWSASTDEGSLGEPRLISGGFNGWWIPPSDGPVDVHVSWTAQRPLNAAIAVSVVAAIACIVLVVRDRRATRGPRRTPVRRRPVAPARAERRHTPQRRRRGGVDRALGALRVDRLRVVGPPGSCRDPAHPPHPHRRLVCRRRHGAHRHRRDHVRVARAPARLPRLPRQLGAPPPLRPLHRRQPPGQPPRPPPPPQEDFHRPNSARTLTLACGNRFADESFPLLAIRDTQARCERSSRSPPALRHPARRRDGPSAAQGRIRLQHDRAG